jgi:hypothetical protein
LIEPDVFRELQRASDPDTVQAKVLDWTVSPDLSCLAGVTGKRERLAAVRAAYDELKRPALERLRQEPGIEIDDLRATQQVIVRASVGRWRELTAKGGFLDREPSLRVLPNVHYTALASA